MELDLAEISVNTVPSEPFRDSRARARTFHVKGPKKYVLDGGRLSLVHPCLVHPFCFEFRAKILFVHLCLKIRVEEDAEKQIRSVDPFAV
jgi:hypothetical protein